MVTSEVVELEYVPRPYQAVFEEAMYAGFKRAMLVWHRRAGKDIAALNFVVNEALKKPALYYYLFPTQKQARKVIWDGLDEEGNSILNRAFPASLIDGRVHNTEMKIKLKNGSLFQLIGTDNADSIAGTNPYGCVFSEYSLQDPSCWTVIVRPILRKNGGWAVFVGTPRGKNHQWEMDKYARQNPGEWFYQKLTVEDTGAYPLGAVEAERREGVSEEIIQQEYYCSYERGVEGSYYGRLIDRAWKDGRIGKVAYEARSVVNTSWDLGYGDSTAVVFWQDVGLECRVVDYYEAHGENLGHYINMLNSKPYVYGSHYFPHDAGSGSLQTGTSLDRMARDLGMRNVVVLKRDDFQVGIEMTRSLLGIAWFDETRCRRLIDCLEQYHKKFNEVTKSYSDIPVHDWSSHGADAFRYMAHARHEFGRGVGALTSARIDEMRQRNLGW